MGSGADTRIWTEDLLFSDLRGSVSGRPPVSAPKLESEGSSDRPPAGEDWLMRGGGEPERLPGKVIVEVEQGDRLVALTPGGGGRGRPQP